ncbi:hypothetical protein AB4M04_11365 [Serratia quinivorans]|uniref:Uncharacterized protein n=1 Tax=Serratia quinivorans TaxID=137545 RepID=A0ABV3UIU9_9GAMM
MTYTKDDVEIFLESTAIGNPIIQGKNYYLKLKSGNKIVSLSASMTNTPEWPNGENVFSSLDGVPESPSSPSMSMTRHNTHNTDANNANAFCWPLDDASTVYASMYYLESRGEGRNTYSYPVPYGDICSMGINKYPGVFCITVLQQNVFNEKPPGGFNTGSGGGVAIDFTDEEGNKGGVGIQMDAGNDADFVLWFHETVKNTPEYYIEVEDIIVEQTMPVNVDNYYMRLKNGKKIKSYTVNSECHQSDLAATPAKPFYVNDNEGVINNGFLWPMGDAQQVQVSMYSSSASMGGDADAYGDTFDIGVNKYSGVICSTILQQGNYSEIPYSVDYYAYIDFFDEDDVAGRFIIGPEHNGSNTSMKLFGWADIPGFYTSNDMNLVRKDTDRKENINNIVIEQDNYYLSLKSGIAIESFTLSYGGYVSTIPASDTDYYTALPFYTAWSHSNPLFNGYCWPLGNEQTVPVQMAEVSGLYGESPAGMSHTTVTINSQPGSINLTRLSATGGVINSSTFTGTAGYNDLNCCYINFTDAGGNEGRVIIGPNPDDNGNTMRFLTEEEADAITEVDDLFEMASIAAEISNLVDANDSLELLRADTATHSVLGLGDVDQDNYYLQLKNGKAITSYTVNSECFQASLTTDSDNLARPFCAMNNGDSIVNAFIWPLGDQQLVDTSVFLGAGESGSKVDFNSESFPMSVNEKSGCICLTRLWVDSSMYATEDNDFKAYITYTDSSGETGQVIVGPNADNSGKTLSILDWTEVFSTVDNMNIEFPEQNGASQAVIYANGRNQVPVKVSLSVRDSNNVSIPLTSEDIAAVSSLTSDGRNNDISELGWNYSSTKGDFVKATYDTQMSRGVTANTIDTGTNLVYVSCPRRVQSSITIAYTVTINGTQYSTSTYQSNYDSIQLLYIEAMPEKLLQYRGSNTHDAADGDSDFIFHEEYVGEVKEFYDNNHPAKQYNSYISLASGDHIVKANTFYHGNYVSPDKTSYINWGRRSANGKVANCLVFPLGNPHTVQVDVSYYAQRYYYEINVNQRGPGELCLTTIVNNDIHIDSGELIGNAPCFVELFDTSGNKGYIALIELDGNLSARICNGDYY